MKTGKRQKTDDYREADLKLVAEFAEALRGQYFAKSTVHVYQRCLGNTARFLHSRKQRLDTFEPKQVPMIAKYCGSGSGRSAFLHRSMPRALRAWLRFRGKYPLSVPPAP
jgi:hypothetical protein